MISKVRSCEVNIDKVWGHVQCVIKNCVSPSVMERWFCVSPSVIERWLYVCHQKLWIQNSEFYHGYCKDQRKAAFIILQQTHGY
jgi:Tfp pilus assembly protein PilV